MIYNKLHENGHLSIKGYLDFAGLINPDGTLYDKFLFCLISPRDVGKSTSLWDYIINDYWIPTNYKNQIVYARNNTTKSNNFIHSFNQSFKDDGYEMTKEKIIKFDTENKKKSTNQTIGTILPISVSENFKSAITDNYELFFWEEFNEFDNTNTLNWMSQKQQHLSYLNFVDTIKTYERHRDTPFHIFLLGNKVSPQNEILLKYDIIPNLNATEDELFIRDELMVDDNGNEKLFKIRFVIAADETFNKIKSRKLTLANALAKFDENTNRYLNAGGWLIQPESDIVSINEIKNDMIPLRNFVYEEQILEFGKIGNTDTFYMIDVSNSSYIESIPFIAFDEKSDLVYKKSKRADEDDIIDLAEELKGYYKQDRLFFNNKYTKSLVLFFIYTYLRKGEIFI